MATPTNKQLYDFIIHRFDEDELDQLCFVYFAGVQYEFGSGMSFKRKVRILIEYCGWDDTKENLLAALEKERKNEFLKVFPRYKGKTTSAPPVYESQPRNPNQVFVSHSSEDAELAHQIAKDLKQYGYDIFITPESIRPGEEWMPAINRGLEESGIFLVLITPQAIQSGWVHKETNVAITLANENEARLFLLDVKECKPPILWRQRQFLSFRNEDYKRDFNSLLRELKGGVDKSLHSVTQPHDGAVRRERVTQKTSKDERRRLQGTISLETLGGVTTPVINKGELLPAQITQTFSTAADDQTQVEVHLLIGENKKVTDNVSLGRFLFEGIAPAPKGVPQIKVKISIDSYSQLTVEAKNEATGKTKHLGKIDLANTKLPETIDPLPPKPKTDSNPDNIKFSGLDDIFETFFGSGFDHRQRKKSQQGADLRYDLSITFEEAILGLKKEVKVRRTENCPECQGTGAEPGTKSITCDICQGKGEVRRIQQTILGQFVNVTTCPTCQGSGETIPNLCRICHGRKQTPQTRKIKVKIPAGVGNDMQIRFTGEGDQGINGGLPGNLYVVISIENHDFFTRYKQDIFLDLPITLEQAKNGGKIEVPTVYGWSTIYISPNTKNGDQVTLPNMGAPDVRNPEANRGEQIVKLLVIKPETLSGKAKRLFDMANKSYRRSHR